MTFQQALTYIHSTPNFARSASCHRMEALMAELGNPQQQLEFVHLAGTNGKGSTAAMVAAVLQAAGYRTGLYTSPYLEHFRERIRLNGTPIPEEALAEITQQVRAAVLHLTEEGMESPNEFELVTAIGLCWYARQGAELVVLEVGLGGRYDATNVIPPPAVCAITPISLDHTGVLGSTVEAIAAEKAGILKPNSLCVLAPGQPQGVRAVVRRVAEEVGCTLLESAASQLSSLHHSADGTDFIWCGRRYHLRLPGVWQAQNLCTALTVVEALRLRGWEVSDTALAEGLSQVRWPGRLELLPAQILLDCCHNPQGIAALRQELDTTFRGIPVIAVMGMLRDKDYHSGLSLIAARSAGFYAISPPSPRALPPEEIAAVARTACPSVHICTDLEQALSTALQTRPEGALLVVCGSIPLVGAARSLLRTWNYAD